MSLVKKENKSGRNKIAIVVSKFNDFITKNLLKACRDELHKAGLSEKDIRVTFVPGAFEIPLMALKSAERKEIGAVICLGAVIKGETLHYELVAQECARGIMDVSLQTKKPVIFEVLACDTIKKAQDRAKEKGNNKGRDAALAALEMLDMLSQS
ncbi:MAG: 6,7-dimethyl-8-ribityllumazine synthase [Candidatus Omnitrophica bacterium]|nr:6,7-dimethyl-8-ribityllumazine synthase [Candidatus Omnitrophota bacterium]